MSSVFVLSVRAVSVSAFDVPSGRVLLALVPLFMIAGALIVYCLADLVQAPKVRYLPKPAWALVILLLSVPVGPIAYLMLGRDRRGALRDAEADDAAADDVESSPDDHLMV